ncbi:MAG: alpha/beta hydrolase [Pseudomonadota bacterium]
MSRRMIRGCEYFVEEAGTGLHTVIFLHGLFMSGRAWHAQALALRNRYRCVSLDLRGHARSSAPTRGYAMPEIATDIARLISTGQYGPCHIVGCAMGATIALHLALDRPELVRSLTLISATAHGDSVERKRQYQALGFAMRLIGPKLFAGRLMQNLFGQHFLRDEDRRIQVEHWHNEFCRQDGSAMARSLRAYAQRDTLTERVGDINIPTLVLAGERDTICPVRESKALADAISGARCLTSAKAAHCPPVETPDEVSDALTGFLTSLQPRRR